MANLMEAIQRCDSQKVWSILGAFVVWIVFIHLSEFYLGRTRFGSWIQLGLALGSFVLYLLSLAYKNFKERKLK